MIDRAQEAYEAVDNRLKAEKMSAAKTPEGRSDTWNTHLKQLFEICQQRCNSKSFLGDAETQNLRQLEDLLQELQVSMAACTSLFDNPHVTTDDVDRCGSKALNAVKKARDIGKSRATETATWNSYRQLVMETLAEVSKVPPSDNGSSVAGNERSLCLKGEI